MAPSLDLHLCRLCAQKKKMRIDIFSSGFVNKVIDAIQLTITMDDSLPKSICLECQRHVESFYAFKLKCVRAESRLSALLANGQNNSKPLPVIKEELAEPEQRVSYQPTNEHNYFTLGAPHIPIHKVKVEVQDQVQDVYIAPEEPNNNDELGDSQVIFEEFVYSQALADVKHPIIEVIEDDTADSSYKEMEESCIKVDVVQTEIKPCLENVSTNHESSVTDDESLPPQLSCNDDLIDNSKNGTRNSNLKQIKRKMKISCSEFSESDYVLKDGEKCDIDYEQIEAAVMKKKDPNVRFKCRHCSKSFSFFKGLRKHEKDHRNDSTSYVCQSCSVHKTASCTFATLATLKQHIYRIHLREPAYYCAVCSAAFRSARELHRHRSEHQYHFSCAHCEKVFSTKNRLVGHMRKHTNEKPFRCSNCEKCFRWMSSLAAHTATHSSEKNFLCAKCGNKYANKGSLLQHLTTHDPIKPFICDICSLTFTQACSLRRHKILHGSDRENNKIPDSTTKASPLGNASLHTCPQCSKTFNTASDLSNHKKIHVKRWSCHLCKRVFARMQILKEHVRSAHQRARHLCPAPGCSHSYTQRTPLTRHFFKQHPHMHIINKKGGHCAKSSVDGDQVTDVTYEIQDVT